MLRIATALLFALVATSAEARPSPVTAFAGDRYVGADQTGSVTSQARHRRPHPANPLIYQHRPQTAPGELKSTGAKQASGRAQSGKIRGNTRRHLARAFIAAATGAIVEPVRQVAASVIGGRPSGCPNRFCGCALSIRIFGHSVRSLWLASNWLAFPRTSAGPGMVAARRGHVFQLLAHIAGPLWRVWDPNSGRGRIREHARSIAGYAIINPLGSRVARL